MKRGILGLTVGLLLVSGGGQAAAATTFGTNLSGVDPGSALTVNHTTALNSVAPTAVAAAGAVAPSDGVVVRWRIRAFSPGAGNITAALRIVRGNIGHGTSATEAIPTAPGTYTFPTRLPIKAGDRIGVDAISGDLYAFAAAAAGDSHSYWSPLLPDGGAGRTPNGTNNPGLRPMLNADLEPDADGDGFGDETQDQCPTDASVQGACPDADGDGTSDAQDACPSATGPASNGGCPIPPPETTITKKPKAKTKSKRARLEFSSSEVGSTFECSFDGSVFAGCVSPTLKNFGKGAHVFQVRARGADGNVDPTPAIAEWKVVKKKKKPKGGKGGGKGGSR